MNNLYKIKKHLNIYFYMDNIEKNKKMSKKIYILILI